MNYPRNKYRYDFNAPYYAEIAVENYLYAKNLLNEMLQSGQYNSDIDNELEKKKSITITFSAMAIESFLNDYAAACIGDLNYYNCYDSLNLQNKFQLIVELIMKKPFQKNCEPYGLLGKLIKNRNNLVHNKSIDSEIIDRKMSQLDDLFPESANKETNLENFDKIILDEIKKSFEKVTDAIRTLIQLVNFFEINETATSSCERMFAKYTLCLIEKEPKSKELELLINLGLNINRFK